MHPSSFHSVAGSIFGRPLQQWFSAILAFVFCLQVMAARADVVTTTPRGIYTLKVAGTAQGESQTRTYFGIQLLLDRSFVGVADSVEGRALHFPYLGGLDSIKVAGHECYVHVLTGPGRGFLTDVEEFRATEVVCADPVANWIQPGIQVLIRPHPHLADLFGIENRFNLTSGAEAGSADNVVAWDPKAGKERVYYFNSSRGRWEEEGIEGDASLAVLRYPYGLYVIRRSPGNLRIAFSGEIGAEAVLLPVRNGPNVFSLPINLSGQLAQVVSSQGDFPVIRGLNATEADLLIFQEPSSGERRGPFYHSTRSNAMGWREVGVNDPEGPVQLDLLSTLILQRAGEAGHVRVEGSVEPGTTPPPLPADPEVGEIPLFGELHVPSSPPPGVTIVVESSTNLQDWIPHATPTIVANKARFQLPPGQTRAFYRLKATVY